MEEFQISVKNLNNLWRLIEIYAVFVLNLCGEKITNMRSVIKGCGMYYFFWTRAAYSYGQQQNKVLLSHPSVEITS